MRDPLDDLIDRVDMPDGSIFRADEVARWPAGTLDRFVESGLLRETSSARSIWYDGCDNGCLVEPELREDRRTGKMVAAFACRQDGCGGLITLDPACLRQWEIDAGALARQIAEAVGTKGRLVEDVPGRIWLLGTSTLDGRVFEAFLARGLGWSDGSTILEQASRLRTSAMPLVFSTARSPQAGARNGLSSAVRLAEIATMRDGRIEIDRAALAERVATSVSRFAAAPGTEQPMLVEAELDILEALAQSPHGAMLQVEVVTAAGYSKPVTRDALKHLRELGFVAKPRGKQRKGDVITAQGREYLAQHEKASSATGVPKR